MPPLPAMLLPQILKDVGDEPSPDVLCTGLGWPVATDGSTGGRGSEPLESSWKGFSDWLARAPLGEHK